MTHSPVRTLNCEVSYLYTNRTFRNWREALGQKLLAILCSVGVVRRGAVLRSVAMAASLKVVSSSAPLCQSGRAPHRPKVLWLILAHLPDFLVKILPQGCRQRDTRTDEQGEQRTPECGFIGASVDKQPQCTQQQCSALNSGSCQSH